MVTRAINLKVIVPRAADQTALAEALWVTHREVNLATRYLRGIAAFAEAKANSLS